MPLYEYECEKCRFRFERIEKLAGPHLKLCPKCKGPVQRLLSPPAIQFKGSGWYVTDYARSSASGNSGKTEPASGAPEPAASERKTAPAKEETTKSRSASKPKKPAGEK